MKKLINRISPQALMALGFLFCILFGTGLLMLPAASGGARPLRPIDALFTATSATCVTGLSVIDIGTGLSLFGQIVLLCLIQVGALGITTLGTFLLVLVGRRLSIQNEFALMDAYGTIKVQGLKALLFWTIAFTFLFEGVGAALLGWRYHAIGEAAGLPMPPGHIIYYAVFHAVSAFCNAGFSLHPDSLVRFQHDPVYLLVIDALVVLGGLGFLVLYNLITIKWWRSDLHKRGRITLHSKVVLLVSFWIIVLSALLFLANEWTHSLSGYSILDKVSCSLFNAIVPRTAGFNAIDMSTMTEGSRFLTSVLMLIGGSPGSSAGGIKTTTLFVLFMTILSMCRNRSETTIFERTITHTTVREAIVIFLSIIVIILTAYSFLLLTEPTSLPGTPEKLMFETISATSTVGLSLDFTSSLTAAGRIIISICMYIGRLGPIAIALFIGKSSDVLHIRYPEEEIVVG